MKRLTLSGLAVVATAMAATVAEAADKPNTSPPSAPMPAAEPEPEPTALELCHFAGKTYSEGAFICYGIRVRFTCQRSGAWTSEIPGGEIVVCNGVPPP